MRKDQKNSKSGIELAAPVLIAEKPPAAAAYLLDAVLVLLALFGAQWCFFSSFNVPYLPVLTILFTALFAAASVVMFHLKRARLPVSLILLLLYAAAGYWFAPELIQGFIIVTNRIMTAVAQHTGFVLPIYIVKAKAILYPRFCTEFILFVSFFLSQLLSWAVVRKQSFGLVFLFTVIFPAGALISGITPSFPAVLLLMVCWAVLLLMRIPGGETAGFRKKGSGYQSKNPAAAAKAGLQLLPVVLLCFGLIAAMFPQNSYQHSGQADRLKSRLTNTVNSLSLFSGGFLAGSSNRVNLAGADSIHFTGKTMLQVQMSKPYPVYLKGFTGSVYNGSSWESLPDADYKDIDQKLGGMNVQNMSSLLLQMISMDMDTGAYEIRVKNVGANKQVIYAPYNLTTTPRNITGVKFINDQYIRSSWLFGTKEYNLYANSFHNQRIASDLAGMYLGIASKSEYMDSNFIQKSEELKDFLRQQSRFQYLNANNLKAYYTTRISDSMIDSLPAGGRNFVREEQAYRMFLYDKDTKLPQGIREKVQDLLIEKGLMMPPPSSGATFSLQRGYYRSVDQIAQTVKNYLSDNASYTLTPGKAPAGRDFTDYFLFENQKGYCVHFATAAVVMLRAMGVPARYAEGYIVTADDYKSAVGGWANVKDYHAHAWVEIYYPGVGWQPFEMTPGFNVAENQTQDRKVEAAAPVSSAPSENRPESSVSSQTPAKNESEPQAESSAPSEETAPKELNGTAGTPVPAVIALSAAALLVGAALLRRRFAAARRTKQFTQDDRNRAAVALYGYLRRLTRFGGEIPAEITGIALKARFSQHTVSEEELTSMLGCADSLARSNLAKASVLAKLRMKYIDGLI